MGKKTWNGMRAELRAAEMLAELGGSPTGIKYDAHALGGALSLEVSEDHIDPSALLLGELDDDERDAANDHIASCQECAEGLLLAAQLNASAPPLVEDRPVDPAPLVDQGGDIDDRFDHGGES